MTEEVRQEAMDALRIFVEKLTEKAGKSREYGETLWKRISRSDGMLRELFYLYDRGEFLCDYKVAGYTLADILVWQVDHFKAYLDRGEEINRYHRERLLLESLNILSEMEENPEPYRRKLQGES